MFLIFEHIRANNSGLIFYYLPLGILVHLKSCFDLFNFFYPLTVN